MAKKTKKQKMIADLRRQKLMLLQKQPVNYELPEQTKAPQLTNQPAPTHDQTQSLYIYPIQLIKKDLTKTFLLSILAISLEVALYLILKRHLIPGLEIKL